MLAYPRVNHVEIKHCALVMMLPVTWHCLICSSTSWASDHCLGTFWMRRLFLGHQLANLLVEPPAVHPHPLFGITSPFWHRSILHRRTVFPSRSPALPRVIATAQLWSSELKVITSSKASRITQLVSGVNRSEQKIIGPLGGPGLTDMADFTMKLSIEPTIS